jgi:HEAT repeat protein
MRACLPIMGAFVLFALVAQGIVVGQAQQPERLVADLRSPDPAVQERAVRECLLRATMGNRDPALIPPLLGVMQKTQGELRTLAASAVSWQVEAVDRTQLPNGLIETLKKGLTDPQEKVRGACRAALASLGETAVPTLLEMLDQKDASSRKAAATVLCYVAPSQGISSRVVPPLMNALKSDDQELREVASQALFHMVGALPALPDGLQALLIKSLTDPNGKVQSNSFNALRKFGRLRLAVAVELLRHEHEQVQLRGIQLLQEAAPFEGGAAVSIPLLLPLLNNSPKDDVRYQAAQAIAVEAMGLQGPAAPELITSLQKGMSDKHDTIGKWCAHGLGVIGPQAGPDLMKRLQGKDPGQQVLAAYGFAVMFSLRKVYTDAIPALEKAAQSPNKKLPRYAASALGSVNGIRPRLPGRPKQP